MNAVSPRSARTTHSVRVAVDRRIRLFGYLAIGAAIIGFTLWVHLYLFGTGFEWDSHLFLLIGRLFGHGLLPYRDLWEVKPPGVFFYVRAVFTLLPEAVWSIRVADFFLYLGGAAVFFALCRTETGTILALVSTALWLHYAHHFEFNAGGLYTEEYAAIFAVATVAAASAYRRRRKSIYAALSGLALALAVSFKHPAASAIVPALVLIADPRRPAAILWFMASAAAPLLAVVVYFWAHGGIDAFLDCNLRYPLEYASAGGRVEWFWPRMLDTARHLSTVLAAHPALPGALFLGLVSSTVRPDRTRAALVLWLVFDFLVLAAQGRYHRHHFILMFPAICFAGGVGAAWILRRRVGEQVSVSAARLLLAAALLWLSYPSLVAVWKERQPRVAQQWAQLRNGPQGWLSRPWGDSEEEIAAYLRERTRSEDRLHLRGYGPSVVSLYWAAERLPASRYFYSHPTIPLGPERERQQVADLEHNRPPYIVLIGELGSGPVAEWIAEHYALETVIWRHYRAEIWARKEPVA